MPYNVFYIILYYIILYYDIIPTGKKNIKKKFLYIK